MNQSSAIKDLPYVVFVLKNTFFAFSADRVKAIVELPSVTKVPSMPAHFRGVITLRGQVLPLLDLRARFGYKTLRGESGELCEELKLRKQDHLNWLAELRQSVEEKREFKLTTDPHKCAFGKWYDSFVSHNADIQNLLRRLDGPHRKIHGIAVEVKAYEHKGEFETSMAIIAKTEKRELAEMIKLFDIMCKYLIDDLREIAIILERSDGKSFAVALDQVSAVEQLQEESFDKLSDFMFSGGEKENSIRGLGKRERDDARVQILDPDLLIDAKDLEEATSAKTE
jgi:chemotaxis signal transduction protein